LIFAPLAVWRYTRLSRWARVHACRGAWTNTPDPAHH
jgi:hypothetical protein